MDSKPPAKFDIRPELLESPWTEDDGVIREFFFNNEESHDHDMQVWEFNSDPIRGVKQCFGPCIIPGLLCLPLGFACLDVNRKMYDENQRERLWSRRLAVTKDGIHYKVLRQKPLTHNPTNACAACCCDVGRYKDREIGAQSKLIPYDRLQDVRTELPAGGTRRITQICGICPVEEGEMITDVDATCEVDTAGGGLELSLPGLVNAPNFRACAIALKHGRDLPPLEEGTAPGTFQASAAQPAATHALHGSAIAGGGPTKSGYAPVPQDMSRETAEQTELLRAIDAKLGELISLGRAAAIGRPAL